MYITDEILQRQNLKTRFRSRKGQGSSLQETFSPLFPPGWIRQVQL